MKKLLTLTTMLTALAVSAFAQSERIGSRQWKLVAVNGAAVTESTRAYIELNSEQTRFSGSTGCNRMTGAVDVRGRRVDFSNVATTKMACVDRRDQRTENQFVRALENADRYRQTANRLELFDRNRLVATLKAMTKHQPDEGRDIGLEDRKWTLEAIKGVPVSKLGRTAFIVFDEKKRSAGGNSSCNVFGGSYTEKGDTLRITDVISTMRACVEDDRMSIEREFLDGLRQTNRFEISRGKLLLYRNERLLLTLDGERK